MFTSTTTRMFQFGLLLIIAISISYYLLIHRPYDNLIAIASHSSSLNTTQSPSRRQIQKEFLDIITESQAECSHNKMIIMTLFGVDCAEIHHFVGIALMAAVASGRRLHIIHSDDRCSETSLVSEWKCLYRKITNCSIPSSINSTFKYPDHPEFSFHRYYINNEENITFFNEVVWYDILSRQSKAAWLTGVFRSEWFGKFGNVFVRSFIQYHIWSNLNDENKHLMDAQTTNRLQIPRITAYRGSTETEYSLEKFMNVIPGSINISECDSSLITGDVNKRIVDVISDLETLRASDYIIGSAKSGLFRLGMELQFATRWVHDGDYKSPQRAFTIDFAWIQDP